MDIYRKLIIICIILITAYIIHKLFNHRQNIIRKFNDENKAKLNSEGFQKKVNPNIEGFQKKVNPNIEGFQKKVNPNIEGFQDPIVTSISKTNTVIPTLVTSNFSNITKPTFINPDKSLSICQYAIKASYQTAWDGEDVSQDMIQYVLQRGCRWLHFDVFWEYPSDVSSDKSNSYTAVVSYTKDPEYLLSGVSKLSMSDVLNYISQNAFTNTPNNGDPLFIQITPKYIDPSEESNTVSYRSGLYSSIAHSIITQFLTSRIYFGEFKPTTPISNIMGKVVFIIDNTVSPLYATKTYCNNKFPTTMQDPKKMNNCYELMTYMNAVNNDKINMKTYNYDTIKDMSNNTLEIVVDNVNNYNVNTKTLAQVVPLDKKNYLKTSNTDSYAMHQNYSINIVPMMYWIYDLSLKRDEAMYNARGSAIVPLSYAQKYIKENPP